MNIPVLRTDALRLAHDAEGAAVLESAISCAEAAFGRSPELDHDDAFPSVEFHAMRSSGLLAAPLARELGGVALGLEADRAQLTVDVLSAIGWGSLPLGRLYEGHVNALRLIQTHGAPGQIATLAADARAGALFGVWNTQGADPLLIERTATGWRLRGAKTYASGAGHVTRPLVTARRADGALLMVVPRLESDDARERADPSSWRAHGMRASASGGFDFTGIDVADSDIIGAPDDYHLQPAFSAGAWRFCAVQLGGVERLLDATRRHLTCTRRGADPIQLARLGQAATAAQGARLWVEAAAQRAESGGRDPQALIAFVNLARGAVERAGLDVIELTQRSIGLAGFLRTHEVEHVLRDLATYLRQPAPDKALADAATYVMGSPRSARDLWRN